MLGKAWGYMMATAAGEEEFCVSFEMGPSPALMLDCGLTIIGCNAAYARLIGSDRATILGRSAFEVFPGSNDRQTCMVRASCDRVLESRTPHHIPHVQCAVPTPDGPGSEERHWSVSNFPLLRADGTILGILHCLADIKEPAHMPHANQSIQDTDARSTLDLEKERLRQLFQQAPGFICVLHGPHHVFELANDAYYQLVGHRQIIGHRVEEVMPEVVAQGFLDKLDAVYTTGQPFIGRALPIEFQRVAGGELEQSYIDLIYQPIFNDMGDISGIFVQGNDVTEAHTLAQEVSYQAAHDALTGLCNRREFGRKTQDIAGSGLNALLYMDIDHLKIVNDRCGHAAGDSLLIEVATALRSQCDDERDLLARLGGDEFALLRRDCSQEDAVALAHRLCKAVKDINFFWQGQRYGVTLSVGVVTFGDDETLPFEAALGLADAACFLAKDKGRNRVQVSSESDEEVWQQQQDMDNVTRLREAMREDRVILFAQKIVGLQDGRNRPADFYEVLARLRNGDGTIIPPSGFIPAAERFGMIEEFDRHIVGKILAHLQARSAELPDEACYFVNLSGATLSASGFLEFIESSLAAHPAVHSSQICFEITETAALANVQRTAGAMRSLIDMGFRFALDDFGSGMASFTYLSHLPVQFVKIDGEFVKGTLNHSTCAIIVEAVSKVARAMDMCTIAESVEFEELIPRLRSMGIDYAQGFALHHPESI